MIGNGTYLVCPSIKHSPEHRPTQLSVQFPQSNLRSLSAHYRPTIFSLLGTQQYLDPNHYIVLCHNACLGLGAECRLEVQSRHWCFCRYFCQARCTRYWLAVRLPLKLGSGGLLRPWGLAFGPQESLFVASDGTGSILRYNSSTGRFLSSFCNVTGPRGITVHYNDLYVCRYSKSLTIPQCSLTIGTQFDSKLDYAFQRLHRLAQRGVWKW